MCRETCVYSAAVRDVLISLASCWIQGTVHSYKEQSEIQQYPPDAWVARNVLAIIIIIREARISLTLPAQYHELEQQQLPSRFHLEFGSNYSGTL